MTVRTILMGVDGPAALLSLAPEADRLAAALGAERLIIAALGEVPVPVTAASLSLGLLRAQERDLKDLIDRMREQAEDAHLRTPMEWRGEVTPLAQSRLAQWAVRADLVIVPTPTPEPQPLRRLDVGGLALSAGRPVLVVPRSAPTLRFDRILLGFKSTREGRAAVAAAIPHLGSGARVLLAVVGDAAAADEAADAAAFLRAHGAVVEDRRLDDWGDVDAGTALLRLATEDRSDLLIIGGYGRGRARELIFGGVTRTVLSEARLPCLMVH